MSNKTRKWRSAIAMVLVICMLFSIFPTAAFANTDDDTINYVSIGDSMANGYGFVGYKQNSNDRNEYDVMTGEGMYGDGAYPLQFEKYLTEQGYDVNHTKLATSAMLAEDLLYLLDGREEFDDGWGGYKDYVGTYDDAELKPHFQEAIEKADVITMGIGNASFGAFMLNKVTDALGVFGATLDKNDNGILDEDEVIDFKDAIAVMEFDEEQYALVMQIYDMMETELIAAVPQEIVEQFNLDQVLDIVSYTAATYVVNYKLLMDKIVEMNPDVKIVLVGLLNTTYGMNITDENGNVLVAFGDMMDGTFDMLNAYMAGLPATMQAAGEWQDAKFYYAEQPDPKFICQKFEELQANGWVAADNRLDGATVRQRNIDAYNGDLAAMIGLAITGAPLAGITLADVQAYEAISWDAMTGNGINHWGGFEFSGYDCGARSPQDVILSVAIYLAIEEAVAKSTNTMDIQLSGLLKIAGDLSSVFTGLGTPPTDSPESSRQWLVNGLTTDEVSGMCKVYGLFKVGNGMSVHPTPEGHDEIAQAVINAYANGHTAQDETVENLMAVLSVLQGAVEEYYDEAYEYAYAYAKAEGYIEDATNAIDNIIAALKVIDLSGTDMTAEFKAEVAGEIKEIIETLEAAKALITAADKLDQEALEALQVLLNEAGEDIAQLVAVLEQAGVDVNNLVIIPALEDAYEVLMNDVVPAIVADLEKAIAEGTEWLMDKAQDAIDAVIESLPDMAEFAHDYILDFLLNNPDDVIAFFTAYGDEIIDVVGEYGEYALAAMGYIAVTYDQEILNFVMENHEEILEVTAMLLKEHGPHAAELIKVYAEETGLCALIQEEIVKIEREINELTAELEENLKVQLAMLNAQLENLYEQLENASGEAKAQIEAAIAELEALIENVEAQIAAIEAMIAELEAKLADAKEELVNALAELDALMAAIKDAIEAGAENIDEIIANVATAIEAVKNIIDRVEGIVDAINAKLAADKEDIIGAIGAAVEKLTSDWNALVEQFEVLKDAVNNIDELTAGLLSAINAYLENATQAALEELKDALYEMAVATGDEIYWFLYNNPDKVVGFFEEYGDEIAVLMEEYGPYALGAIGYLAMEYGDEIVEFAMENKAEIIEVTAMLLEKHGENAAKLINVYAEYFGWCDEVREVIADIEAQIDALEEKLADMYAQYESLKAQLEDLYAQLDNASEEVKAAIEAAIAEVEALIAEVEKAIEEIENAIEALEAQLAAAKAELEKAIAAIEAVVEAIKTAIENGVETVEEILAVIEAIVDFAEETIAGVKTAVDGIVNAVEETVAFVEKLIANGIVAAEMIAEIIDTVMDIIDGVKAELEKGDIEAAIEEIRNQLTNGYEELNAMLVAIDTAIAEELEAIVAGLEDALAMAQDEFEEALYNATHGELACDAKTIAVYGGETVATEDGYAAIVAEEWGLTQTEAVDMADVILYQADPQIFVTALLDSVSGDYAANWAKYIGDEAVLAYLEQAKAELKDVLADEYGEEAAAVAEPLVDSFLFAVVEYAIANIETIEYLSRINEDALIVAAGMYNPVQGLSVTYGGETIDIEAMCQYLIEVTDVYNLLYAIAAQNAVFVDVSEAEAAMMSNVDVDALLARAAELKAEAIALFAEAQKALEENDFNKASALMEQANALYTEIDNIVSEVLPLVEALDSSYATEAGHAYIAEQILAAIEKADHECEWAIDDNEHCYYCVNCGEEFVCGAHEFDSEEDTVCDVCGYERIIIDPTPEITTSSIVVYYLNENNAAIKDTTVREITTTGSYRFNIPDPIVFNGVEYLFNSLIDKDASDSYEAELEEGRFFVDVDVMPTTSSVLEFVLKYISEATVASIEISSTDHKTNYYVGDALDVTNLKLLVTYTNSQFNYVNVTPAMISGFDTTTAGEKTVTITYEGATTQYTITVSDPGGQGGPICVDSVAISPDSVSLEVGNTEALTANITPANAQIASVVWTSDNDAVATVDQNGVVTAVAKGNATITVTVTDVDDCVETATCVVTVTKTSSGGSFGGGGGYIKPAKPEVLVPDNAVADGVTVTVDHIDYLTVNEVKDLVAKDDNLEVIGGRDSGALVAVKPANAVTSFAHPVQLTVPVSKSALQNVDDVNKLTLALVTTDAQGNIQFTYVGGNYDASKGTFTAYVNQPGKYVLMEKLDIVKLELTIDRYVVFVNGEPIINDVPSRIVNNRTIVPAARVLHHMGCTVEWLSDTRTVAVTLPNGDVLNLPVDEPIPGFGAAPVIENGRTLVPIAYIADMMDAHVQWVGNDRKVIIVK